MAFILALCSPPLVVHTLSCSPLLSHIHTLSCTLTHTHSLSLTHTHTLSHTHTHTLSLSLCLTAFLPSFFHFFFPPFLRAVGAACDRRQHVDAGHGCGSCTCSRGPHPQPARQVGGVVVAEGVGGKKGRAGSSDSIVEKRWNSAARSDVVVLSTHTHTHTHTHTRTHTHAHTRTHTHTHTLSLSLLIQLCRQRVQDCFSHCKKLWRNDSR